MVCTRTALHLEDWCPLVYILSCKWFLTFLRIMLLHLGPSKMKELCPFKMSGTFHWRTSRNFPKTWILKNNSARTSNLASLPLPLPHILYGIILYLILTLKSSYAVTSHSSQWSTSHGQQSLSCDVPCHSDLRAPERECAVALWVTHAAHNQMSWKFNNV